MTASQTGPVVVLAGGTGGAKLARGMLDVVGAEDLVVIANTADDIEIHGGYVSPDPDLVTFWLADRINDRGWGIEGDTFNVMEALRELGEQVWFNLGDRDLALALQRAAALRRGERLTEFQLRAGASFGVHARVLVMTDEPVRTRVQAAGRMWSLQEYLIQARTPENTWPEVEDVQFHGARSATATPEVLEAITSARAIIIGPSNPIISIGPILATGGLAAALSAARAPKLAVSPFVGGEILKGPTAAFMRWRGVPASSEGVAELYAELIDGLVLDAPLPGVVTLVTDLLMDGAAGRARLAAESLDFAGALRDRPATD
jgi:LPPG:FO 2-phospho-L-lactate transferase